MIKGTEGTVVQFAKCCHPIPGDPIIGYLRKGQEVAITYMIEAVMSKRRILEIYLNVAEWGEGVFGAEAAAQHYWGVSAAQLGPAQAATMAAMLPRPRFFDRNRDSPALARRVQFVQRWMGTVALP